MSFIIAPIPWLTSASRSQTGEVTPCDVPHPEMMGLALPGIIVFLVMHWTHMGAWFTMAQNRSWPHCGLPVLMVSCIPDCITTRNRFFSSLKTVYFGHLSHTLRDVFISQNVQRLSDKINSGNWNGTNLLSSCQESWEVFLGKFFCKSKQRKFISLMWRPKVKQTM